MQEAYSFFLKNDHFHFPIDHPVSDTADKVRVLYVRGKLNDDQVYDLQESGFLDYNVYEKDYSNNVITWEENYLHLYIHLKKGGPAGKNLNSWLRAVKKSVKESPPTGDRKELLEMIGIKNAQSPESKRKKRKLHIEEIPVSEYSSEGSDGEETIPESSSSSEPEEETIPESSSPSEPEEEDDKPIVQRKKRGRAAAKPDNVWISELKDYLKKHPKADPNKLPTTGSDTLPLRNWIRYQKRKYKKRNIDAVTLEALEDLKVDFDKK